MTAMPKQGSSPKHAVYNNHLTLTKKNVYYFQIISTETSVVHLHGVTLFHSTLCYANERERFQKVPFSMFEKPDKQVPFSDLSGLV